MTRIFLPVTVFTSALILASKGTAADPSFEPQTVDAAISIGYGLAIGDMDGDGKQDILLADAKEFVWYKNPTWEKHVFAKLPGIRDNVCIAAEDIDGDGKVEIAVGANWNPSETVDEAKSGSVHYLIRPTEAGKLWGVVDLPHEPTVHRMRWMQTDDKRWALVVLPLHGRGNKNGAGNNGVKVQAYFPVKDASVAANWEVKLIDDSLHVTHNLDRLPQGTGALGTLVVGGKEGLLLVKNGVKSKRLELVDSPNSQLPLTPFPGVGEIRWLGKVAEGGLPSLTAVEPFHGNVLAVYEAKGGKFERGIIDDQLAQGHALGAADFSGTGEEQIVVGWREPNAAKQFGLKLYAKAADGKWGSTWIDQNKMACEDLKIADLNGDGKPDIIAAGRATKNVIVYWNKSGK